jgi:hypothetical protein
MNNLLTSIQIGPTINSQLREKLPGLVTREILDQLPNILNNHHIMQNILNKHSVVMTEQIDTHARTVLDKIADEDKYHEVTKTFYKTLNNRADGFFENLNTRYMRETEKLQNQLEMVESLQSKVKFLEKTNCVLAFCLFGFGVMITFS